MSYASYLSSFSKQLYNSYRIVAENLVKYMPAYGFVGISFRFLQNSVSGGVMPRTPLVSLRRSLRPPNRLGRGILPPHSHLFDSFGVSISSKF